MIAEKGPETVPVTGKADGPDYRVYTEGGRFIGLFRYHYDVQVWKPEKIFC